MKVLFLVGLLALGAQAQSILGPCPQRPASDADVSSFVGTWYLAASLGATADVLLTKCVETNIALNETTGDLNVHNKATIKLANQTVEYDVIATRLDDGSYIFNAPGLNLKIRYTVVHNDDDFTLSTTCLQKKIGPATFHSETASILTRTRYPTLSDAPVEVAAKINAAVGQSGFVRSMFLEVDNRSC